MMTRSPMIALVIELPGPIAQFCPIRTPGPITALAPISVPAPTAARGPMTAPGSTRHTARELGGGMDGCIRRDALRFKQRQGTQCVGIKFASHQPEASIRL